MHPHSPPHTHTLAPPPHTPLPLETHKHLRAGGTEEKVFEKKKVFREDLKELTKDA